MKKLGETRDYLQDWLDRHKKATELAPAVHEALEEIDWQIKTMNQRPLESGTISTSQVDEQADITYRRITNILPQMPQYDLSTGILVNSITNTSSTVAVNYILQTAIWGLLEPLIMQTMQSVHTACCKIHISDQIVSRNY